MASSILQSRLLVQGYFTSSYYYRSVSSLTSSYIRNCWGLTTRLQNGLVSGLSGLNLRGQQNVRWQPIVTAAAPQGTAKRQNAAVPEFVEEKRRSQGESFRPAVKDTAKPRFGSKASRRAYNERNAPGAQRLSKVMAAAGVASRRACEEIIFAGRVTVNGVRVLLPQTQVDPRKDSIYVDGRQLPKNTEKLYFVLNKPKGFICSNDPSGHRLVVDLFEEWAKSWAATRPGAPIPRLFTVGRLDVATTGMLLVTNDGDFMQRVAHPSSGVTKEYIFATDVPATRRQLEALAQGTEVEGVHVAPLAVAPVEDGGQGVFRYAIEVAEGRNQEVRRLVDAAGIQIKSLKRTRIGGMRLPRDLMPGEFRPVSGKELSSIIGRKGRT